MKIYTDLNFFKCSWQSNFKNIDFNCSQSNADVSIILGNWKSDPWSNTENTIYWMPRISSQVRKKMGDHTPFNNRKNVCDYDDILNFPDFTNYIFTSNDFKKDCRAIRAPRGFMPCNSISQPDKYWLEPLDKNSLTHHKVYWKGSSRNHLFRKKILEFYKNLNDARFDVADFSFMIYQNKAEPIVYNQYINKLCNSDMNFCIRGTYDGIFSFLDAVRCGCAPILINCMLDIGWENIFNNVEDFALRFDLQQQGIQSINQSIIDTLSNDKKITVMKKNSKKFFSTFIEKQFSHLSAWSFFVLAKCIEIHKKNYDPKHVDNKFISSEVLDLLELSGKL